MKLFLDKNKTLLPRVDFIYLLTRILSLVAIGWFTWFGDYDRTNTPMFYVMVGTFAAQLAVFAAAVKDKFDLKLAYLMTICYDLLAIPILVYFGGGFASSFYLLYFLTISVAAYQLTSGFAAGVTVLSSVSYVLIMLPQLTVHVALDLAMRLGFMWVYFLALSYGSEHLRRSERRLLKLFDTLNLRTSELEKTQAQVEMIYENTHNLAALLDAEGVVNEIMRIMGYTLQFSTYAIVFRDKKGHYYYRARSVDGKKSFHLKAITRSQSSLIKKVANQDEAIFINNINHRDDYQSLNKRAQSLMIVPMTSHGDVHGLLLTESLELDHFGDLDVRMLSIVARSAALALENANLHQQTEALNIIDELTGAYNYRFFVKKLEEEKKRALRYDLPLSLIMVDIDWFKKINDTYGHEVGNDVLRELSGVIQFCIRDVDVFIRYGGEEFVVILPQTPQVEAAHIGERIRSQVEEMIIDTDKAVDQSGRLKITVSVGVTSFPENGKSHEDLVSVADQALYRAKGSGKNLVCSI